ncbi:MAG: hypothetical protein Q9169_004474 [Polycauliona sp. 2 TL-2023]
MAAQSQLQQPVFTLNLKSSSKGELTFGSIDKKQYKGDLMTAPVNNQTHAGWIVDKVSLSSGKAKTTQKMVFDSGGGPNLYADQQFVDDYWTQVPGSVPVITSPGAVDKTWIYPCAGKLPAIEFSIGNGKTSVTIPGSKLNAGEYGPQAPGACLGALQHMPGFPLGFPGVPFWTSAFVVFNQAVPSISIAAQA